MTRTLSDGHEYVEDILITISKFFIQRLRETDSRKQSVPLKIFSYSAKLASCVDLGGYCVDEPPIQCVMRFQASNALRSTYIPAMTTMVFKWNMVPLLYLKTKILVVFDQQNYSILGHPIQA